MLELWWKDHSINPKPGENMDSPKSATDPQSEKRPSDSPGPILTMFIFVSLVFVCVVVPITFGLITGPITAQSESESNYHYANGEVIECQK